MLELSKYSSRKFLRKPTSEGSAVNRAFSKLKVCKLDKKQISTGNVVKSVSSKTISFSLFSNLIVGGREEIGEWLKFNTRRLVSFPISIGSVVTLHLP